jgi:DNA-binding transcriptional ArsR family regulator
MPPAYERVRLHIIREFSNVRDMSDVVSPPRYRDYSLDDTFEASSSAALKALADPLRRLICDLVLERAMSVTELAELSDRPKGTVAYHVDVLVDAGLLKVVRTRQVRAVEERFYGRVARTFVIPDISGGFPFLAEVVAEYDIDRVAGLLDEGLDELGRQGGWGTTTYRRARIPRDRVAEYARRLEQLTEEFVDEPRAGDIEFGLFVALFPTNRLPRPKADRADSLAAEVTS